MSTSFCHRGVRGSVGTHLRVLDADTNIKQKSVLPTKIDFIFKIFDNLNFNAICCFGRNHKCSQTVKNRG
jgi:hypothetical protein